MIDNLAVFISCAGMIWISVALFRVKRKRSDEAKRKADGEKR